MDVFPLDDRGCHIIRYNEGFPGRYKSILHKFGSLINIVIKGKKLIMSVFSEDEIISQFSYFEKLIVYLC